MARKTSDVATFIRCHVNAFRQLGIPRRCLYDNAKVVVLGRTEAGDPVWNERFLDFTLRLGFDIQLCKPYRAQTKGRVEAGVKYVRNNFWPGVRFVDEADLNRQAQAWVDGIANVRLHGTTHERPVDRLAVERSCLGVLPGPERVRPFLREERRVARDGYVQWDRGYYGVPWTWAGKMVEVQTGADTVEIWSGDERIAVHPRAVKPGQRFTLPGQWAGLVAGDQRPSREALAAQVPSVEVKRRPLAVYEALAGAVMSL